MPHLVVTSPSSLHSGTVPPSCFLSWPGQLWRELCAECACLLVRCCLIDRRASGAETRLKGARVFSAHHRRGPRLQRGSLVTMITLIIWWGVSTRFFHCEFLFIHVCVISIFWAGNLKLCKCPVSYTWPLILASVVDAFRQHLVPWCLPNGDFLFPSFFLHLLSGIPLQGRIGPSPYLFISAWAHGY